jgi:hypothetical protein
MRIIGLASTGTALAIVGVLAVCATNPALAALDSAKGKRCIGKYQSVENGLCINNSYINPGSAADFCGGGAACYRGGSTKHKRHKPINR